MQQKPGRINVYQMVTDRITASLEKGYPMGEAREDAEVCRSDLPTRLPHGQDRVLAAIAEETQNICY